MRLGDIVRGDDEAIVVGQLGQELVQQLFVGRPGAARDDTLPTMDEPFDVGERLGLSRNGRHAVEAGIATHGDIIQTVGLEQLRRGLILHEEMRHVVKLLEKPVAIPTEEIGIGL